MTSEYEHTKLVKKTEQLQKQLDFLNSENNKLTSNFIHSQKELGFFQNSKREIDILTKKLVVAEDQKCKFEKTVGKMETVNKRLNEQFEKSKKNVLNETSFDVGKHFSSTLKDQQSTID